MVVVLRARRAALVALMTLVALAGGSFFNNPEAAGPPESSDAVLARLAASLVDADKQAMPSLLAPSRLRIHLRLPGGRDIGDERQRYGAEQVAVLLREYLTAVEMRPFDPEVGPRAAPAPDRRVWVERPRSNPKAKLRPHGILHVSVRVDEEGEFEHQRLYVGLRETGGGWKVEEILHLP